MSCRLSRLGRQRSRVGSHHLGAGSRYQEVNRCPRCLRITSSSTSPIGRVPSGQLTKYADVLRGLEVLDHVPVAGDLDGLAAEVETADGYS